MAIHLHNYVTEDINGLYDGAVLMHREATTLIARSMDHRFHDIRDGAACVQHIGEEDTVYAGCGPYAALYHLWRQKTGGKFRIVREVHTSFWSGYWTQEELCATYLREGDLALFPTEFARQLYCRHFPLTTFENSAVAYPITAPLKSPGARQEQDELRIGYIGALSDAKGFDQVLDIFANFYARSGGRASLHFAGKPNNEKYADASVRGWLHQHGVPPQRIHSYGEIHPQQVGRFYNKCDLILFPSLASRETLGRVVIEALWHGLPVIASELGPAAELLPSANLIPSRLSYGQSFQMDRVVSLGRVDVETAVEMLMERSFTSTSILESDCYGSSLFLDLLHKPCGQNPRTELWDRRIPYEVSVTPRGAYDTDSALTLLDEIFSTTFDRKRMHAGPRLSDMRAFPRVVDTEVCPPLRFNFSGGADTLETWA